MRLAIHFARLGPYHLARLESAVEVLGPIGWEVVALETAGADATYDWERTRGGGGGFGRRTVFPEGVFEKIPARELKGGIFRALDEIQPDALAVAGWGTVDARACLAWCKKNGARAIVMSETRAADGRRVWWREWVKSRIVRKFDGALCGGESHRRYLEGLGMPRGKIELGYNVVDNRFFGEIRNAEWEVPRGVGVEPGAGSGEQSGERGLTKGDTGGMGEALDSGRSTPTIASEALPQPYFLASCRFIRRKNLGRLIRAYAKYVESFQGSAFGFQVEGGVWPLVLLGDGELRGELEGLCGELGLRRADSGGLGADRGHSVRPSPPATGQPLTVTAPEALPLDAGCSTLDSAAQGAVIFAGFRQIGELPRFYAGAGAFVHPALEEPWGLVLNEAMAGGLPVLSSRNVGAAEELVFDGETGFLFDPVDVDGMARAMLRMASMPVDEKKAMGRAARELVEKKVPKRAFGEGLAKLLCK